MTLSTIWDVILAVLAVSAQLTVILSIFKEKDLHDLRIVLCIICGVFLPGLICAGFYPKLVGIYSGYLKATFPNDKNDLVMLTSHVVTIISMPLLFVSPGVMGLSLYIFGKKACSWLRRLTIGG